MRSFIPDSLRNLLNDVSVEVLILQSLLLYWISCKKKDVYLLNIFLISYKGNTKDVGSVI